MYSFNTSINKGPLNFKNTWIQLGEEYQHKTHRIAEKPHKTTVVNIDEHGHTFHEKIDQYHPNVWLNGVTGGSSGETVMTPLQGRIRNVF